MVGPVLLIPDYQKIESTKVQTPLPQKPQNLSQIRKQMKDEKNQKPVTSSPKLSQTKQTNKANELANKAITKAGKEMKGFVKNLFGSDKKTEQKSSEQSRTAGNKKPEQKHDTNKSAEQQKFVKPSADMVIERTLAKPETDSTASSGQDKKGDVTMMKMIQQRLKTKPKPPTQSDQPSKQSNKPTKSEQKQIKKDQKKENIVPDAKRRASKNYIDSFLPEKDQKSNQTEQAINQEIPRKGKRESLKCRLGYKHLLKLLEVSNEIQMTLFLTIPLEGP